MSVIKKQSEIDALRRSGQIAASILSEVAAAVAPGVSTSELADLAAQRMREAGAESAFLGYRGYPGVICVSVNDEVVHGIPGERRIALGDLVSLDVGIRYRGYIGDTATTVMVGVSDPNVVRLVEVSRQALGAGIASCCDGVRVGVVSNAIETTVVAAGYAVVRDFVGHGVGRKLHEEPQIPNFGNVGQGPLLRCGMTLCIEPMVNFGSSGVRLLPDGWTAVTQDGGPSAHFEHMVVVKRDGCEILSQCA